MADDMPWLFHIPDVETAAVLGPHLYALGGAVIADPAHLPDDLRYNLHTVGAPYDDGEGAVVVDVTIHHIDWSRPVDWNPDEPEDTAASVYEWADQPGTFIPTYEDIPEDAPEGVAEWLDLWPSAEG